MVKNYIVCDFVLQCSLALMEHQRKHFIAKISRLIYIHELGLNKRYLSTYLL